MPSEGCAVGLLSLEIDVSFVPCSCPAPLVLVVVVLLLLSPSWMAMLLSASDADTRDAVVPDDRDSFGSEGLRLGFSASCPSEVEAVTPMLCLPFF